MQKKNRVDDDISVEISVWPTRGQDRGRGRNRARWRKGRQARRETVDPSSRESSTTG